MTSPVPPSDPGPPRRMSAATMIVITIFVGMLVIEAVSMFFMLGRPPESHPGAEYHKNAPADGRGAAGGR